MHIFAFLVMAAAVSTTTFQISALVGFLLPALVAIVQQQHWPNPVRIAVAVISSIIAAVITAWAEGSLTLTTWSTSVVTVFTLAMATYKTVWVPSGIAPAIERLTSGRSNTPAPPTTIATAPPTTPGVGQ